MNAQEFEEYFPTWKDRIVRMARRMARGDLDLADDLAQEAFWKLAEFDLERVSENETGCIWRVVRDHMINVLKRERRARMIVPRAVSKWRTVKKPGAMGYVKDDSVQRLGVSGPRHLDAAPLDEDWEESLWDDL